MSTASIQNDDNNTQTEILLINLGGQMQTPSFWRFMDKAFQNRFKETIQECRCKNVENLAAGEESRKN